MVSGKTGKELREIDKIKRKHFVNDTFGLVAKYVKLKESGDTDPEDLRDIEEEISEIAQYFDGGNKLVLAMERAFINNTVPRDVLKLVRGTTKQKKLIVDNLKILLRQSNKGGKD